MLALRLLSEGGEGPNTELQWLLLVGMAFFFLIVIVGWLTSSKKQEPVQAGHEAKKSAKKDVADELIKIEGIGPKVLKVLKAAGVTTFDQLAHAKPAELQKILDAAGMHMMNPEGWIDQAKLAAKGDWQGLEKLQAELKGGRKTK